MKTKKMNGIRKEITAVIKIDAAVTNLMKLANVMTAVMFSEPDLILSNRKYSIEHAEQFQATSKKQIIALNFRKL